jgi:hypothetical protein
MRNEKHCKLALLLIEVKKNLPHFPTCVKLGRIRMWNPDPDPDLDWHQTGKLDPVHSCTVCSKVFINGNSFSSGSASVLSQPEGRQETESIQTVTMISKNKVPFLKLTC